MSIAESRDGSTTRELPVESPARPYLTLIGIIVQIAALIAGAALVRSSTTIIGVSLLVVALILIPVLWKGWGWTAKYPTARIVSSKKVDSLEPGMWIVRPSSRDAVRIWDEPSGSPRNPKIADGLTRDELEIVAPVYAFRKPPKGSESA